MPVSTRADLPSRESAAPDVRRASTARLGAPRRPPRRQRVARRWELRSCGIRGHLTFEPTDRPDLLEGLRARTAHGEAWRCLRCGDYVLGPPAAIGRAEAAPTPLRGPALRDAFILRLFAIERSLRGLVLFALAYGVWKFDGAQDALRELFRRYLPRIAGLADRGHVNIVDTTPVRLVEKALSAQHSTLMLLVAGIALYGLIEMVEAVGLWSMRRWGEYVAVVATSVFLPYEIYDLFEAVTPLRLATFGVNLALVVWLVVTKRLFGVRGGAAAFEAQRESESILHVERTAG